MARMQNGGSGPDMFSRAFLPCVEMKCSAQDSVELEQCLPDDDERGMACNDTASTVVELQSALHFLMFFQACCALCSASRSAMRCFSALLIIL